MTLNCHGQLIDLSRPLVMGILNATPDSFFDGGNYTQIETALSRAETMLREGATIIDIGGASSRPGAQTVGEAEELRRVVPVIREIARRFPSAILSVDTWRAGVARAAVDSGAHMVNDISAGGLDPEMFDTVAALEVPYVLMHMQGAPQNMQHNPVYSDVVTEILDFFIQKTEQLRGHGVKDIVVDPGFGFGKTVEQNYTLLNNLHLYREILGLPVLAGISRKSMVCRPLEITPAEALNGTSALHMVALQHGASILRVHDVKEAVEVIKLHAMLKGQG